MTISDRPAVKRRVVEVLAAASDLAAAQVSYAYPGAATRNEAVWLGDITGVMDEATFGTGRPGRNDEYSIELVVAVSGQPTEADADARCQELLTAVCETLFVAPRLGDDYPSTAIYPGRLEGPNGFRVSPNEPAASVAQLTLSIRTAIRGAAS